MKAYQPDSAFPWNKRVLYNLYFSFFAIHRNFIFDFRRADLNLIERDVRDTQDFIRTETYALRLKPAGARKVTEEVNKWLNKRAKYRKLRVIQIYP
ncbi:hypothetical protein BHR79_08225 [Methanohalophilus halophilus]|uniref:Uncharacterized protein n=1 Tax=Methanohalophilus halophilus TaxID=2177 RepID=A0A1L3Q3M2_9EURY|nr:hypothetical protein BHR79_08225 [Methanohalophilus halophilus]